MSTLRRLCFLAAGLLLLAGVGPARAGVADAPGGDLQVALITYGPGETYWERFGHDAIELRDLASGEAYDFNYGVFDFDEKGFLLNFARGRMHYMMDAEPSAADQDWYRRSGRSITRQVLALSPAQAAALRDFLLWNLRPENRRYDYDYYTDNCTTRVRDAFDRVLGGTIHRQLAARPGLLTYREQTDRLMSAQPWLMLLLDFGLGPYADQPLDAWQESFLPGVLAREIARVRTGDGPLVAQTRLLAANRVEVPPAAPPDLRLPLAAAGVALALALWLAFRWSRTAFAVATCAFLLLAGLAGTGLAALWAFTEHRSAWANANLLLFNPLDLMLLRAAWRLRSGFAPSRLARGVIGLQLVALPVALGVHLLPGTVQQNQPWLLFAWPVWLAIAWIFRRGTPAGIRLQGERALPRHHR